MSEESAQVSWLDLLGKAGAISALIGAWLYLTGWSFGYNYFFEFGIGVSSVDLDNRILPLYGFLAVREFWWQVLVAAVVAVALLAAMPHLRVPAWVQIVLVALAVPAAFTAGYGLGDAKAARVYDELRRNDWPGFSNVVVHAAGEFSADPLAEDLASGCYRLVFANASTLFLIRPVRGLAAMRPPILVLDRRHVTTLRIDAFQHSCDTGQ